MSGRDPFDGANAELIRRVYAYVAYRIGDGPDADDVTSETFARALRYRRTYDRSKGSPSTWLLAIARRCLADRAAERATEPLVEELGSGTDLEHATVTRLTLAAALRRLPERDQDLLLLRYAGDLSGREIAAVLELTPGAVRVALNRALARLRATLEADDEPAQSAGIAAVALPDRLAP